MAKLPLVNNERILPNVGFQNMAFGNGILGGLTYASHEVSHRWVYADTFSWTRGKHSFKFGGEYRLSSSKPLGGSVQTGPTSDGRNRQLISRSSIRYRQARVDGFECQRKSTGC
jgi:hypothetical protein